MVLHLLLLLLQFFKLSAVLLPGPVDLRTATHPYSSLFTANILLKRTRKTCAFGNDVSASEEPYDSPYALRYAPKLDHSYTPMLL
jgi:hypothetical protein